jgi:hypothetical protein
MSDPFFSFAVKGSVSGTFRSLFTWMDREVVGVQVGFGQSGEVLTSLWHRGLAVCREGRRVQLLP